ncbi:hypothetical protein O5D80_000930 [Batrachochytrium dendrobatidis]|nr:hypothetical protein O5D80_000930 [Batrachochytrium dendrobatidis]
MSSIRLNVTVHVASTAHEAFNYIKETNCSWISSTHLLAIVSSQSKVSALSKFLLPLWIEVQEQCRSPILELSKEFIIKNAVGSIVPLSLIVSNAFDNDERITAITWLESIHTDLDQTTDNIAGVKRKRFVLNATEDAAEFITCNNETNNESKTKYSNTRCIENTDVFNYSSDEQSEQSKNTCLNIQKDNHSPAKVHDDIDHHTVSPLNKPTVIDTIVQIPAQLKVMPVLSTQNHQETTPKALISPIKVDACKDPVNSCAPFETETDLPMQQSESSTSSEVDANTRVVADLEVMEKSDDMDTDTHTNEHMGEQIIDSMYNDGELDEKEVADSNMSDPALENLEKSYESTSAITVEEITNDTISENSSINNLLTTQEQNLLDTEPNVSDEDSSEENDIKDNPQDLNTESNVSDEDSSEENDIKDNPQDLNTEHQNISNHQKTADETSDTAENSSFGSNIAATKHAALKIDSLALTDNEDSDKRDSVSTTSNDSETFVEKSTQLYSQPLAQLTQATPLKSPAKPLVSIKAATSLKHQRSFISLNDIAMPSFSSQNTTDQKSDMDDKASGEDNSDEDASDSSLSDDNSLSDKSDASVDKPKVRLAGKPAKKRMSLLMKLAKDAELPSTHRPQPKSTSRLATRQTRQTRSRISTRASKS